jgi:hypothetical protein
MREKERERERKKERKKESIGYMDRKLEIERACAREDVACCLL